MNATPRLNLDLLKKSTPFTDDIEKSFRSQISG